MIRDLEHLGIICAIGMAYFAMAGLTWRLFPDDWRDGTAGDFSIESTQIMVALAAMVWPIVLPWQLGVMVGRRIRLPGDVAEYLKRDDA